MQNHTPLGLVDVSNPKTLEYISKVFSQTRGALSLPRFNYSSGINGNVDLIVAGCSFTHADGVEHEDSWGAVLSRMLNTDYVNISGRGLSMVDIVSSIFDHIRRYGNPKTIAVLATQLTRGVEAVDWVNTRTNTLLTGMPEVPDVYTISTGGRLNDRDISTKYARKPYVVEEIVAADSMVHRSLLAINHLIIYCKVANINLVWGTWDESSQNLYRYVQSIRGLDHIDIGEYVELPSYRTTVGGPIHVDGEVCKNPDHFSMQDNGSDLGAHAGPHYHVHWADLFYDKLKSILEE